ncbi:MAG TPA: cupin domain-containing protein, partial [Gemmatimonadales bacterium]|nr:cupin domain-containing protein [Gemmatimonadales bacterium]
EGAPLELLQLPPGEWRLQRTRLGAPASAHQAPLHCVPANWWQAAHSLGSYTLVNCTVAPGFEFADLELLAAHSELAAELGRTLPEAAAFL